MTTTQATTLSTSGAAPTLMSLYSTGSGSSSGITLNFSTTMLAGTGTIWVTDGAVQTVIDRVTGLPTVRIVGGTDTHAVAASSVTISGNSVTISTPGLLPSHAYHVVMDKGALASAGNVAFAGLRTTSDANAFTSAAEGATAPLTATLALDGAQLVSGGSLGLTIKFSTAVDTLDPSLISAPHASIANLHASSDHLTWYATLTANDTGVYDTTNTASLDLAHVTAANGGTGTGSAASSNYVFDERVSAYVGAIVLNEDTGVSAIDDITSDPYIAFSGGFVGTVGTGQRVELTLDGGPAFDVTPAYVSDGYGVLVWTYNGDAARWNDGTHTITARLVDPTTGAASATVSKTITVDTTAPTVASTTTTASGGFNVGNSIVIKFNEAVYLQPGEDGRTMLRLVDSNGDGNGTAIELTDADFSDGHKTLTIAANNHHLLSSKTYATNLASLLTDAAGNYMSGDLASFTTTGAWTDTVLPSAWALRSSSGGLHKAGDQVALSLVLDEPVKLVGDNPVLGLNNGAQALYTGMSSDSRTLYFTYTVGTHDASTAKLDVTGTTGLAGHVADLAGNLLDAAHISFGHLAADNGYGFALDIGIDTVAPAALAKPALATASDTGATGDGITSITSPTIKGSGAEAYANIELYVGTSEVGYGYADGSGNWSASLHAPFVAGAYSITAVQRDAAGNASSASPAFALTVDTAAPVLGTPVTGYSGGGYVTLVFNEAVSLSANAKVSVYDSSHMKLADLLTSDTSSWQYVYDNGVATGIRFGLGLSFGAMTLELASGTITDAAGNVALIGTPSFTVPHLTV